MTPLLVLAIFCWVVALVWGGLSTLDGGRIDCPTVAMFGGGFVFLGAWWLT